MVVKPFTRTFTLIDGIDDGRAGDTVVVRSAPDGLWFEHHGLQETVERRSGHVGRACSWRHYVPGAGIAALTIYRHRAESVRRLGLAVLHAGSTGMLKPALVLWVHRGKGLTAIVLQADQNDLEFLSEEIWSTARQSA